MRAHNRAIERGTSPKTAAASKSARIVTQGCSTGAVGRLVTIPKMQPRAVLATRQLQLRPIDYAFPIPGWLGGYRLEPPSQPFRPKLSLRRAAWRHLSRFA